MLDGRVALVTGASSAIGSAVARRLADSGAELALTYDHNADNARQLAEELSTPQRRAVALHADFADPATPRRVVRQSEERLGGLSVIVAAASAGTARPWKDVDVELWDQTMAVNVRAPFMLAQVALPAMIGVSFGRILLMSSFAAFTGGTCGPHHATSKAALHGLVHYLAPRVADEGVTVNAIALGLMAGTRALPVDPDDPRALPLPIPVGRLGRPEEVADLAVAMLRNAYLTNKVVGLDGGLHPD
jgi:3-oxoacyl-[acyl-carrier protein] reductase